MKQVVFLICLVFLLPARLLAYTSPGNPSGYVNDFAGILAPQTKSELENKLASLDASTSAQVAVVTIKSLGGDSIENYAVKLFEEWKIGQKGIDNGVLFLVAVEDRKVRIEVGYGLEGALTDAETSSIIRNVITPAFKANDYDRGISEGVAAILKAAAEDLVVTNTSISFEADKTFDLVMNILVFGIPLLLWFVSVMSRSKSWWLGGIVGAIIGAILMGIAGTIIVGLVGLFLDYIVSKEYKKSTVTNHYPWWIGGKNGFGSGSSSSHGGFGGFGGGRSGGGGSSGSW